ncbi:TonB-dependent receptor [Brevundimonas sp.]|uniref:TonB-dependent receptor n=1 Tax=Brevundimonas sp. TaxID=1871086 RepID=UPI003D0C5511
MTIKKSGAKTRSLLFAATILGGLGWGATAFAQSAAASDQDQQATSLEEVVVTARKREERLQDVPLAITSFSSEALEDAGVQTLRDLSYLTPGLTINSGGSEFGVSPVIRGLTNLNGGAGDANVSVFLDGVYLQNASATNLALIDIARIEVIKGPVSALYGRNAFAGAINYVSAIPNEEFRARAEGTLGNDGMQTLVGSISGPVVPGILAARLAAGYDTFDGSYTDNITGQTAGGFEKKDIQGVVSFTPTERLSITAAAYYGDDFFAQSALGYNVGNCGARTAATAIVPNVFTQYCGRLEPDAQPVEVPALASSAGVSGNQREVLNTSVHVDYDFGFGNLSYIYGYNDITQQRLNDFLGLRDGIRFELTPLAPGNPAQFVNLQETFGSDGNNQDSSHELRFASNQDQPFRWAVGGFYFDSEVTNTTIIGVDGRNIPAGRTLLSATGRQYLTADGRFAPGSYTENFITETQKSAFVGLDYDVTSQLTVSGEARYTEQEKSLLIVRSTSCPATATGAATATCAAASGPNVQPIYPFGGPGSTTGNPSGSFEFSNFRLTAKYQFTPGIMGYASVADGTKGGGFNGRATVPDDLSFDPETNDTFEVGLKTSLFENRLQLNAAIFHIETQGIQISGPSANTVTPGLVTKNFGSTTSNGFEFEAVALPLEGVRLNLGIGYSDPKFNDDAFDFGTGPCALIPTCAPRLTTIQAPAGPRAAISLDGLQVPRTSKLQVSTGVSLNGSLSGGWDWFARSEFRYESKQYSLPNNYNYFGPRYQINARAGVEYGNYTLTAFVDNLTDDHTPETASYNSRLNDFNANYTLYLPQGRTFGLKLGYVY